MPLLSQPFKSITKFVLVFTLSCFVGNSQQIKELKWSQLDFIISKDSTTMVVLANDKPLNGKFKLLYDDSKFPTPRHNITEFIDGKTEGESKYYVDGILIGINEFKNGVQDGTNTVYDKTGKHVLWKIRRKNGKQHGLTWYRDKGDSYYIMGNKATKEEFEEYERTHIRN